MRQERESVRGNGISLTLVTDGRKVGRGVGVGPARQVDSPARSWLRFSAGSQGGDRGEVGSAEEPTRVRWSCPPGFRHQSAKASAEQESRPQSRLEKGNLLEGKEKVTGS